MEQKDMNNLSPAELKAMADTLSADDDERLYHTDIEIASASGKAGA